MTFGFIEPSNLTSRPTGVAMRPILKLSLALLVTGSALLQAQEASSKPHRIRFALVIPYAPPVAGASYTAEYAIEVQKPQTGGGSETLHSETLVARDSYGRIRHELHDYVPEPRSKEPPPLLVVVLLDPVARLTHILDPILQIDDRKWLHAPHLRTFDFGSSKGEDLGLKTISGIPVMGVRLRSTVLPRNSATGDPEQVVDEIWYSRELQLVVFERQTDSAGLELTVTMSKLDRNEPDPALFKIPRGYHLPSANRATAGIGMWSVASPDQTPNISGAW